MLVKSLLALAFMLATSRPSEKHLETMTDVRKCTQCGAYGIKRTMNLGAGTGSHWQYVCNQYPQCSTTNNNILDKLPDEPFCPIARVST